MRKIFGLFLMLGIGLAISSEAIESEQQLQQPLSLISAVTKNKNLLSDVFIFLPNNDFLSCALVSKLWKQAATDSLDKRVRADSKPVGAKSVYEATGIGTAPMCVCVWDSEAQQAITTRTFKIFKPISTKEDSRIICGAWYNAAIIGFNEGTIFNGSRKAVNFDISVMQFKPRATLEECLANFATYCQKLLSGAKEAAYPLERLCFDEGVITPEIIENLKSFTSLKEMQLLRAKITPNNDENLLCSLTGLKSLTWDYVTGVTSRGLNQFSSLQNIEKLYSGLNYEGVKDKFFPSLEKLTRLTSLEIAQPYSYEIKGQDLTFFQALPNLKELTMDVCFNKEEVEGVISQISNLTGLQRMTLMKMLYCSDVSEEDVTAYQKFTKLTGMTHLQSLIMPASILDARCGEFLDYCKNTPVEYP